MSIAIIKFISSNTEIRHFKHCNNGFIGFFQENSAYSLGFPTIFYTCKPMVSVQFCFFNSFQILNLFGFISFHSFRNFLIFNFTLDNIFFLLFLYLTWIEFHFFDFKWKRNIQFNIDSEFLYLISYSTHSIWRRKYLNMRKPSEFLNNWCVLSPNRCYFTRNLYFIWYHDFNVRIRLKTMLLFIILNVNRFKFHHLWNSDGTEWQKKNWDETELTEKLCRCQTKS